jgi:tetratricopeptide (TPR) repeat protein
VLLAAALLWLGRADVPALVAGVLAGTLALCLWNLAYRWDAAATTGAAATPVGYANGLALLAAIAALLAAGLALETGGRARLVIACAGAPALAVLWLAESRGAWSALAAGALATASLHTRRPAGGLAVATAAGIAGSIAAGIAASAERRAYWSAALAEWVDRPLHGSGAGTWGRVWLERRDQAFPALDAHSLYFETLSELGPVALAALALLLGVPLLAAARAAGRPAVAAAAGGFVALVVHLSADWDWELPAVTAAGFLCAAALLRSARDPGAARIPRPAAAVAAGAVLVLVVPLLAGNVLAARALESLRASDPAAAVRDARRAARLQPWAAEPWRIRAEAERALGDRAAAAGSVREAIDRDPDDVEVWRTAGRVLYGAARTAAEERVRELDPLSAGGAAP